MVAGVELSALAQAGFLFLDEFPSLALDLSADLTEFPEPDEEVSFTVEVTNPGAEEVTLTSLEDDQIGTLDGDGSCSLPQALIGGGTYTCTYTATVSGAEGDVVVHTVAGNAQDDEVNVVGASDGVEITITDGIPPRILALADTSGTEIDACSAVTSPPITYRITFSEPVVEAEEAANYRLVAAGPDGDFSTADCGETGGDDIELALVSASSDGDPSTPTVELQPASALPEGWVRVIVCSEVEDLVGHALDGDGDGVEGDPFLRTFRFDAGNFFANGAFDDCPVVLDPWMELAVPPGTVLPSPENDVDGSTLSGSVRLFSEQGDLTGIAQCSPLSPLPPRLQLRFQALFAEVVPVAGSPTFTATVVCESFALADCAGFPADEFVGEVALSDTAAEWRLVEFSYRPTAAAMSALCSVSVAADMPGSGFEAFLDNLFLGDATIFANGFESGSTSAWPGVFPGGP